MANTSNDISIGCIGKCTFGLKLKDVDEITDSVNRALLHPKGKEVFRKYLTQARRKDDLACLEFYEKVCEFMEKEENYFRVTDYPTIDSLKEDFEKALTTAEDLQIPEIDLAILERYIEALNNESRDAMMAVLHDTKVRLLEHLKNAHRGFRMYALQPCPRTVNK